MGSRVWIRLFVAVLVAGALAVPASALADCAGADLAPTVSDLDVVRSATLCLVNEQRAATGLAALTENARLSEASTAYSNEMVARRFFAHVDPDGITLVQRLVQHRYLSDATPDWLVGENIAWGETSLSTPRAIVDGWMHSDEHRANMLEPRFQEIGLGIALGSPDGDAADRAATYTTDFGTLHAPAPSVPSGSAPQPADPGTAVAASSRPALVAARRACTRARTAARAARHTAAARRAARRAVRLCARARRLGR